MYYTIVIVIVNRYSLIFLYERKSICINDLHVSGLPRTVTPFGDRVTDIYCGWVGFILLPTKFQGMICQCPYFEPLSPDCVPLGRPPERHVLL